MAANGFGSLIAVGPLAIQVKSNSSLLKEIPYRGAVTSYADYLVHGNRAVDVSDMMLSVNQPGAVPRVQIAHMPSTVNEAQFCMWIADSGIGDAYVSLVAPKFQHFVAHAVTRLLCME
jgi:hypothetical protein